MTNIPRNIPPYQTFRSDPTIPRTIDIKKTPRIPFKQTINQPGNPTFEQWIRHSDYREQIKNAISGLNNKWKALKTLLKAYKIPIWDYRPPTST